MEILRTDRLLLRTWKEDDFPLARSLWGDTAVMAFLGGPLSDERVQDKMRGEIACAERHGVQYWPVFEKQAGEFVGCCGLRPWAYTPHDGHELGFHLVQSKWGKGYAFEAAQGVLKYGFEKLSLTVLRSGHHPDNLNSKKILLKLGFRPGGAVFYKPTGLMHPTYQLDSAVLMLRQNG
jgi:RimJ/RimL family protein N-acetyltransferase